MQVSIVVPVFNEEGNIGPLADEIARVRPQLGEAELILVDDGSTDRTWDRIQETALRLPFVTGVRAPAHRGQSAATFSGLLAARGAIIVTMDGDMQNDPADIPRLLEALGDADCVCGYRLQRKDSWSRRAASRLANAVRNLVTRDGIIDTGCSLKAFRRECVADLPRLNGMHRFMPAYFMLNGRRIVQVPVHHRARTAGLSKYTNLKRLPAAIGDLQGFRWYRRRYLREL